MKYKLIFIVFCVAALAVPACKDMLHMSKLKGLQGRWHLMKEVHQGRETSAEDIKNGFIIFDAENNWHVEANGKTIGGGSYTVDPDKNPKTIDYTFTDGEEKGQKFFAVYELDGDSSNIAVL
jgi:uncharacterized protein (TIGR03067 family)